MTETITKNYGFIPDEIKPEDYVFGAYTKIEGEPLQASGQWDMFLPQYERQYGTNFDTQNCTNYGTLNCIETLLNKQHPGDHHDFSERYTGVLTGTTRQGNQPHKVIEIIRKESGLIPEARLPFDEGITTWDEYYSPDPMHPDLLAEGRKLLDTHEIQHEWVFTSGSINEKQEKLMKALQYSPIGVSVKAWREKNGLYYKDRGESDNHWCMLYGYERGRYWKIFDHYDGGYKKLAWDYDFGFAKRYSIRVRTTQSSFLASIIQWIREVFLLHT